MPEISCIILNVQELLYLPFDYDYRFDFFYSLEPEETVRRLIPFEACLHQFCSDEIVSGYMESISAVIISAHHLGYYQTPETTIFISD